jgi:hypothetical protein
VADVEAPERPVRHGTEPSGTLNESQIERDEYQDNSDVYDQPFPEVVPEEKGVYGDHDSDQAEHVKRV